MGPIEQHLNYDAQGNIFELSRENARYDLQYDATNQLTRVKSAALGAFKLEEFDADGIYETM